VVSGDSRERTLPELARVSACLSLCMYTHLENTPGRKSNTIVCSALNPCLLRLERASMDTFIFETKPALSTTTDIVHF